MLTKHTEHSYCQEGGRGQTATDTHLLGIYLTYPTNTRLLRRHKPEEVQSCLAPQISSRSMTNRGVPFPFSFSFSYTYLKKILTQRLRVQVRDRRQPRTLRCVSSIWLRRQGLSCNSPCFQAMRTSMCVFDDIHVCVHVDVRTRNATQRNAGTRQDSCCIK